MNDEVNALLSLDHPVRCSWTAGLHNCNHDDFMLREDGLYVRGWSGLGKGEGRERWGEYLWDVAGAHTRVHAQICMNASVVLEATRHF